MSKNEIQMAIDAAEIARATRPEWTGSWYAIGRAIRELRAATAMVPQEAEFEPKPAPTVLPNSVKRHRNGTVCLDPTDCAEAE